MNYVDIKEASKATGKSEKTIRRFLSKPESKHFVYRESGKLLVEVNYLFSSYPPVKRVDNEGGRKVDIDVDMSIDVSVIELKSKLALYEQEIQYKDQLLSEKDGRIMDLQKALLLLEAPKKHEPRKKKWWQF